MQTRMMLNRKLWVQVWLLALWLLIFTMPAAAWAACSTVAGSISTSGPVTSKVSINEYNYSKNYIELKINDRSILSSTNNLANWKLRFRNGTNTNRIKDFDVKDYLTSCAPDSDYLRIDLGSIAGGSGSEAVVVLWSDSAMTQEVDYFRTGQGSYPTYQPSTCFANSEFPTTSTATHHQSLLSYSASKKDIARSPDGTGRWLITPYSGANQGTVCNSNNGTLALTKTLTNPATSTVAIGQDITFRVQLTLDGNADQQSSVQVVDQLPLGLSYISHSASRGTYNQSTGLWSIDALSSGQSETLDVTARVTRVGTLTNSATVESDDFLPDSVPPATASVTATQPLQLTKTVSPNPAAINSPAVFSVTVKNTSPFSLPAEFTINDTVPPGLTAGTPSMTAGAYTGGVWTIPAGMPAGASYTLTLPITTQNTTGTFTNTATAIAPFGGANLTASATLTVSPSPPTAAKSFNPETIQVGNTSRLTITLSNPNNTAITGTALTDNYPAGMLNAATPDVSNTCGGTVTASAGASSLVLNGGNIPANGSCSISVTVTANVTGTLTNSTGNVTSTNAATAPPATATLNVLAANLLAYYHFEDLQWSSSQTRLEDFSGNSWHATSYPDSTKYPEALQSNPARAGNPGTCGYAGFNDGTNQRGYFSVPNVGLSESAGARTSVAFWVYFTGNYNSEEVVLGWPGYNIYFNDNRFGVNTNGGGDVFGLTLGPTNGTNSWNDGQWRHVVVVLKNGSVGETVIYVNGVSQTVSQYKTPSSTAGNLRVDSDDLHIGKQANYSGYRFTGKIDEVKIFNGTLTAAQAMALYNETHPCPSALDHFLIEHDGSADSCRPESITIKACANATCTELSESGGITASLNPGGNSFEIGTSGSANVPLTFDSSAVSPQTLSIAGSNITPAGPTQCAINGTIQKSACQIAVSACPAGKNFNCLESSLALDNAKLYTKLVGTPFSFDVVALNKDNGQETNYVVSGGSDKSVTVELGTYDPADCASGFCPLSPPQTQTLTFSATDPTPPGLGRKKTADFTVQQAYKKLKCRVTETGQPTNQVGYSTDGFSVRPKNPILSSTASTTNYPSVAGGTTKIAGEIFTLKTESLAPGGYTDSLQQVPDKIKVQNPSIDPAVDPNYKMPNNGILTPASLPVLGSKDASFNEVGYLYLEKGAFADAGFTQIDRDASDCKVGETSDDPDPSNGQFGCLIGNKNELVLGRFIPSHFEVKISAPAPLTCPPGLNCAAVADRAAYSGQPFEVTVTAKNALGAPTTNYRGVFAKEVSLADQAAKGNPAKLTGDAAGDFASTAIAASEFSNGGSTPPQSASFKFSASSPAKPTDLYVAAAETAGGDGVKSNRNPADSSLEEGIKIIQGRLRLGNAFGTVQRPPTMDVRTQYWSGNSWVKWPDGKTSLSGSLFSIDPGLATLALSTDGGTGPWTISFTGAQKGTAKVCANLDTAMTWLKYPDTPCGKVTFGVYPAETKKTVHTRELYR